jgi:nitric oxide dioxygenase
MNHAMSLEQLAHSLLAQALLTTCGDAILAVDRDGIITFWNPGAERIFGFVRDEAVGKPLEIIIPDSLRTRHDDGFRKTMATGETRYGAGELLAVPALTRDGRRISIEFSIVLMRDAAGAPEGMAAILRDVTARFEENRALRKRLAELERAAQLMAKATTSGSVT